MQAHRLGMQASLPVLLIILSISMASLLPIQTQLHGQPTSPARLEVWSPDVHSSNITDPGLTSGPLKFPTGTQFTVLVNLTYPGNIATFDISLNYNLTLGPNVLQAVRTGTELSGGLLDPNRNYGSGCHAAILSDDIDGGGSQPGRIRIGAALIGSTCNLPTGMGTLFTLTFQVTGIGAGSIDIDDGTGNGSFGTNIVSVDSSGNVTLVQHDSFSAYFRNKAGLPPHPFFTHFPGEPVIGNRVFFNATETYDPENKNAADRGIQAEPVVYDSNGDNKFDAGDTVLLGPNPEINASLSSDPYYLSYVDSNDNQKWDQGETVVYNGGHIAYGAESLVINGTAPTMGTALKTDSHIKYVPIHHNGIWDNGYIWDFGDGSFIVPGMVASHVFRTGVVPASGVFEVKLVVFDKDDGLANRLVTLVTVHLPSVHDVVVIVTLSKTVINQGDPNPLTVTVKLTNMGHQNETLNLNTNDTVNGGTTIKKEYGISVPAGSSPLTFSYSVDTSSLATGTYTVTSQATLIDLSTGEVIPYTYPSDSFAQSTFVVRITDENPIASFTFTPANPIVGDPVFFDGSASVDPDGFLQTFSWSFGDNSAFSVFGEFISHSYNSPGNYTVALTITDSDGLQAMASLTVPVRLRPAHDVGIRNVSVYPLRVVSSQSVNIQILVANDGSNNETVSVTAYYDSNIIETENGVFVRAFNNAYLQIIWDTTGVPAGNYTISATAFLPGDPTPADNTVSDGRVQVLPPPTLSINPSSGPPGTTVQIRGSGFANPGQTSIVEVTFDDQLMGLDFTNGAAFNLTFSIPLSEQGPHNIKALDEYTGAHAKIGFQVLASPSPATLEVTVNVGSIYFHSDTVVIYSQVTLNGQPTTPSTFQLQLFLPNGTVRTLTAQSIGPGLFKATFSVSKNGPIGTYLLVGTAHTNAPLDASSIASFEVKQSWVNSNSPKIAAGAALAAVLGLVAVSWKKGYFKKKQDETLPF